MFVPGVSELFHGSISETGMGNYLPRVRRDWGGNAPRGNSRRARLARDWPRAGGGVTLGQWDWGSAIGQRD